MKIEHRIPKIAGIAAFAAICLGVFGYLFKGLLGAKFVDVTPGKRGRILPSGSTIAAKRTSSAVEMLDVLQAFDPRTRVALQQSVKGLGKGYLGRGQDLNEMFAAGSRFYSDAQAVSDAILARPGAAARFAPSAETLAGAYDPVREELARGFAPQARVLQAFADEGRALDQTIAQAPPALDALHRGLDAATPLLDETAGLARATRRLTADAPEALRQTTGLLRETGPALRASRPLLERVADATSPTVSFLKTTAPVIDPSIRALRSNIPPLAELARRGCDVLDFARNWRSTLGFGVATDTGDPLGDLDAGEPGLGPMNSLRVVPARVLQPDSLMADNPPKDVALGRSPYPAPCAAVSEKLR